MAQIQMWRTIPLHQIIYRLIELNNGPMLEKDLIRRVESVVDNLDMRDFYRSLLELEIRGKIHVKEIKKGQRLITFIKEDEQFLAVTED